MFDILPKWVIYTKSEQQLLGYYICASQLIDFTAQGEYLKLSCFDIFCCVSLHSRASLSSSALSNVTNLTTTSHREAWLARGVHVKGVFVELYHHFYSAGSKPFWMLLNLSRGCMPKQCMTTVRDAGEQRIYIEIAPDMNGYGQISSQLEIGWACTCVRLRSACL